MGHAACLIVRFAVRPAFYRQPRFLFSFLGLDAQTNVQNCWGMVQGVDPGFPNGADHKGLGAAPSARSRAIPDAACSAVWFCSYIPTSYIVQSAFLATATLLVFFSLQDARWDVQNCCRPGSGADPRFAKRGRSTGGLGTDLSDGSRSRSAGY